MAEQTKMPPITPYLTVKGANEAIEFYKKAFGATENARLAYEDGKRLMHAEIALHGSIVLLSDEFPEFSKVSRRRPPTSRHRSRSRCTSKSLPISTRRSSARPMPAQRPCTEPADMFWGGRFAALADPFNHRWLMHAPLPPK